MKWKEMGSADFMIPSGSDVTYSFEKVFGRKLKIRGSLGKVTLDHSFDVRSLDMPLIWNLDGAKWVPAITETFTVSIRVWWQGGDSSLGDGPASHSSDVMEQLRALGYVE